MKPFGVVPLERQPGPSATLARCGSKQRWPKLEYREPPATVREDLPLERVHAEHVAWVILTATPRVERLSLYYCTEMMRHGGDK